MLVSEATVVTRIVVVEPCLLHVILNIKISPFMIVKWTKVLVPMHVEISAEYL